jgi:hypothetical protein
MKRVRVCPEGGETREGRDGDPHARGWLADGRGCWVGCWGRVAIAWYDISQAVCG